MIRRWCAGRPEPAAAQAATLALGQPAPDAELLAVVERVLQALHAHHAPAADLLGLPGGRSPLREEQVGVDPEAVGLVLPTALILCELDVHAATPAYVAVITAL